MADYVGSAYDTGTGDVISAIQRPAVVANQPQQIQPQFVQQQPVPQYGQADDLINNAIAARQNIEAQRQVLAANLSGSHPKAWKEGIVQQIKGLDQTSRGIMQDAQLGVRARMAEATQARIGAHYQATTAAAALRNDREHSIDEQGAALMNGLGQLDAAHRNGDVSDEDYNNHLLDLGQQYGLGLRHPDAGKMFSHFIDEADRRKDFLTRRNEAGMLPNKVLERYGRLIGNISEHELQSKSEEQKNTKDNKPNVPYSKNAQLAADILEKSYYDKNYPGLAQTLPQLAVAAQSPKQNAAPAADQFDYSKIPSGTTYTDPSGVKRRKQ